MRVFRNYVSDNEIITLVMQRIMTFSNEIQRQRCVYKHEEKSAHISANVQFIFLSIYSSFCDGHNFLKSLPTRFYICPLLPPIKKILATPLNRVMNFKNGVRNSTIVLGAMDQE